MQPIQLVIYGLASFIMSIFSGVAGGGGGFVITPLGILLGLSPAQAVSSGKFNGLAVTLSELRSYRGNVSRRRIFAIMILAFLVGLLAPLVIKSLDGRLYRIILGSILLILLPIMYYKRIGVTQRQPTRLQVAIGSILLTISLLLQGIFSGGLGSLVNVVLMGLFGQTANEAQITRRWAQLILNTTIIFGVLSSGLIVWPVVVAGLGSGLFGSAIGARIALRKGDAFAAHILLILMGVSALVLIAGAL